MKYARLLLLLLLIPVVFAACKKTDSTEIYTPIVDPVIPDFSTRVNAAVAGFVTDENNNSVEGATVQAGSISAMTDRYGYFKCSNVDFAKTAGFIKITKAGYFKAFRSFIPVAGKETFVRIKLITLTTIGTIEAAGGGVVTAASGIRVSLPANGVVNAANGNAYAGSVGVAAHWINAADQAETQLTMPGDLRGVDSAGHLNQLVSFGMMAVELTGSGGELLQIAAGKKAALTFPVPASLLASAPASIALWSFSETKGLWQQEGFALKQGNAYVGEVSHFSYWNCDVGMPLVNFSAQLLDTALKPLVNVPLSIAIENQPNSARVGYSDANGEVYGMVPANSNLVMEVLAPCNNRINFKNITTTNADLVAGALVVQLGSYGASFNGTVNKCNGNPVTDGYVILTGFGGNNFLPLQNGVFTASGTVCPGASMGVIAFDRTTGEQSVLRQIDVTSGINQLGTFSACTPVTTETVNVTMDGVLTTYTLPQYLFGGNYNFAFDSTGLNALDLLNGNQIVFDLGFTGGTTGTFPLANNRFVFGGLTYQFNSPVSVTISSYGLIGQFITGSFSGTSGTAPNPSHTFAVSFNIKRDQ